MGVYSPNQVMWCPCQPQLEHWIQFWLPRSKRDTDKLPDIHRIPIRVARGFVTKREGIRDAWTGKNRGRMANDKFTGTV